ncbi:MAG: short-chain dehydrogenase [Betaproteobacteria bacterium RIFCSPLOWO2_02_FULL_66_14]|nr:MAG: short-chain dehydrogenase [Betaproteobacteria bacterium RIFCSPLOWO2_02_FULL_66_14]
MALDSLFDLSGKVALVTGSTKGIGKSAAEEMARAGARVVVSSRKGDACEAVRREFEAQGWPVIARPCNISRKEDLQSLVELTLETWGRIDVVVANAAANPYYGPLQALPDETFDKVMLNNVKSTLWLANLTLPGMAARGGGSFIVVASIAGMLANTVIGIYGISKAADLQLVRNLAAEWGPKNVRVNAIAPGLIKTDFARALWEDEKRRTEREALTPMRRLGEAREIGGVAAFLASDAASFITGQTIVVDGGVTIV